MRVRVCRSCRSRLAWAKRAEQKQGPLSVMTRWLVDIAETLRSQSQTRTIDYSLVFSRARALGIVRILGVSFWLAKNVLLAELPEGAEEPIAADPRGPVLG